ncbi:cytochrome c [Prevotella lacticifex]|nr:cytochrome c [Prevotella lacticifex]
MSNKQIEVKMNKDELDNKIVIYQTEDGKTQLDVKLENETVWLTQAQLVQLFDSSKANVSEHIKHIYEDGELAADSTVRKFRTVQTEGKRQVGRNVAYYNLDLIISLGYRVNTKRGIQFRQWATSVLRDYLIKGYAINQRIREENYQQMVQLVRSMARTVKLQDLSKEVRNALLDVVVDYTFALDRLDDYDYQRLSIPESSTEEKFHATYEGAMKVLAELREKFGGSGLFANEKDDSFKSSIGQIYQTFGGQDLYPTVEEKAAMLLYLVTKNHSFSDGNKRIAATLFLWFMNENGILYDDMHNKRIDDATLVALTLLIAESRPEEKDTMIKVVVNLIGHAK